MRKPLIGLMIALTTLGAAFGAARPASAQGFTVPQRGAITIPPPGVCPGGDAVLAMVEAQIVAAFPGFTVTLDVADPADRYSVWRDFQHGVCMYRVSTRMSVDKDGGGRYVIVDGWVGVADGEFVDLSR